MSCGRNQNGRAGYNASTQYNNRFVTIYTPNPSDENTKALSCSSGSSNHSLFILKNGIVYICDSSNFNIGPTISYQPDPEFGNPGDKYPAIFVSAGTETIGIVASDGSVWMKGYHSSANSSAFGLGSLPENEYRCHFDHPDHHLAAGSAAP